MTGDPGGVDENRETNFSSNWFCSLFRWTALSWRCWKLRAIFMVALIKCCSYGWWNDENETMRYVASCPNRFLFRKIVVVVVARGIFYSRCSETHDGVCFFRSTHIDTRGLNVLDWHMIICRCGTRCILQPLFRVARCDLIFSARLTLIHGLVHRSELLEGSYSFSISLNHRP